MVVKLFVMKSFSDALPPKYKNIILEGFDPIAAAGFTQVPNYILKSPELSVGAKLTYAMLLSYAWHNDFCFPGQETLAEDMGVGLRSVVRYIDELDSAGYISIKRNGLGKTNTYKLFARVKPQK